MRNSKVKKSQKNKGGPKMTPTDQKILGIELLKVDTTNYSFPTLKTGKKNKIREKYLLGNGFEIDGKEPELAADAFIKREYMEVQECYKKPQVLVPDTFVYNVNPKYAVVPEVRSEKQEESSLKNQDGDFNGSRTEEGVFNKMQECFKEKKNVIIFSEWCDQDVLEKNVQREFDFLILSADAKTIIHIECKTTYKLGELVLDPTKGRSAVNQLQRGKDFFEKFFKFPEGWRFVKAAYFGDRENAPVNDFIELDYILGPKSNLKKFFADHLQKSDTPDTTTYIQMVKLLMFVMFHVASPIITSRDSTLENAMNIDKAGKAENIIFWTKEQYELKSKDRVIFTSTFGTGKTQLIKWKIEDLHKTSPKQNIVMVVCEDNLDAMESIFSGIIVRPAMAKLDNCEVIALKANRTDFKDQLEKIFGKYPDAKFFIDEMPLDFLKSITQLLEKYTGTLWIAVRPDTLTDGLKIDFLPSNFLCPKLIHPLRATANIMKFSNLELWTPTWVPKEINPDHYVQRGPKVTVIVSSEDEEVKALDKMLQKIRSLKLPTVIVASLCHAHCISNMIREAYPNSFLQQKGTQQKGAQQEGQFHPNTSEADSKSVVKYKERFHPNTVTEDFAKTFGRSKLSVVATRNANLAEIQDDKNRWKGSANNRLHDFSEFGGLYHINADLREDAVRGCEFPVVVRVFPRNVDLDITLSRCTSKLIVVLRGEFVMEKKLQTNDFVEVEQESLSRYLAKMEASTLASTSTLRSSAMVKSCIFRMAAPLPILLLGIHVAIRPCHSPNPF